MGTLRVTLTDEEAQAFEDAGASYQLRQVAESRVLERISAREYSEAVEIIDQTGPWIT